MRFIAPLMEILSRGKEENLIPEFDPHKGGTPHTIIHPRLNPDVDMFPNFSYTLDKPYCPNVIERWRLILQNLDYQSRCKLYENIPVYIWDFNAKDKILVDAGTRVVIKSDVPIQGNAKNGLALLNEQLFVVSRLFRDKDNPMFVLLARPLNADSGLEIELRDKYFSSITPLTTP